MSSGHRSPNGSAGRRVSSLRIGENCQPDWLVRVQGCGPILHLTTRAAVYRLLLNDGERTRNGTSK